MAQTSKTYCVAGTSTIVGSVKVRFGNDFVSRIKILDKNGHTDVELIELGSQLTKAQACRVLAAHPKFQSEDQQLAIQEYAERNCWQPEEEALTQQNTGPRDGMVDITDLKSVADMAWRFESARGYQSKKE